MSMTLTIAIYAAILATITALVQVFNYRRDSAKVKVRMYFKHQVNMYDKSKMKPTSIINIHAANTGRRPITIIACYVWAGDIGIPADKHYVEAIIYGTPETGTEIGEGKSQLYTAKHEIIDKFDLTSKDLCAYATDATLKRYWSDPIFIRWIKATRCKQKMIKTY